MPSCIGYVQTIGHHVAGGKRLLQNMAHGEPPCHAKPGVGAADGDDVIGDGHGNWAAVQDRLDIDRRSKSLTAGDRWQHLQIIRNKIPTTPCNTTFCRESNPDDPAM